MLVLKDEFGQLLDMFESKICKAPTTEGLSSVTKWWARRKPLAARIFYAGIATENISDAISLISGNSSSTVKILDPFMGGGTFAVEPATMGAIAYGCDLSPIPKVNADAAVDIYDGDYGESILDIIPDYSKECERCGGRSVLQYALEGEYHDGKFAKEIVGLGKSGWICTEDSTVNKGNRCSTCNRLKADYSTDGMLDGTYHTTKEISSLYLCEDCMSESWDKSGIFHECTSALENYCVMDEGPQLQAWNAGIRTFGDIFPGCISDIIDGVKNDYSPVKACILIDILNSCNRFCSFNDGKILKAAKGGNVVYWCPDVSVISNPEMIARSKINSHKKLASARHPISKLSINAFCGDSSQVDILDTVDAVITDPPYYDALSYNNLSYLFAAVIEDIIDSGDYRTRDKAEAVSSDMDTFAGLVGGVFKNAAEQMKDDGVFMFTYHHDNPDAISAIIKAIDIAGLSVSRVWVYKGERSAVMQIKSDSRASLDMLIVCQKIDKQPVAISESDIVDAVQSRVYNEKITSINDAWVICCAELVHMNASPDVVHSMRELIESNIELYKDPQGVLQW